MKSLSVLRGRAVLVLDDEESIRMLLSEGLAAHGLKVDCAASAEQALSLVLGNKYDAILCDLKLSGSGPNADGYGVAQRLRVAAGSNRTEIIFMSGDVIGEQGDQGGVRKDRALQKPFRISDVLSILMAVVCQSPPPGKS
jgi:CheY-like chemotaxis protein